MPTAAPPTPGPAAAPTPLTDSDESASDPGRSPATKSPIPDDTTMGLIDGPIGSNDRWSLLVRSLLALLVRSLLAPAGTGPASLPWVAPRSWPLPRSAVPLSKGSGSTVRGALCCGWSPRNRCTFAWVAALRARRSANSLLPPPPPPPLSSSSRAHSGVASPRNGVPAPRLDVTTPVVRAVLRGAACSGTDGFDTDNDEDEEEEEAEASAVTPGEGSTGDAPPAVPEPP